MAFTLALEAISNTEQFLSLSPLQLRVLLVISLLFLWVLSLFVYRLYFSPLAKFPGPKLAAATGWVETYHDVVRGGQFIFKIREWHAKYGG
jgi:hypothetical protein